MEKLFTHIQSNVLHFFKKQKHIQTLQELIIQRRCLICEVPYTPLPKEHSQYCISSAYLCPTCAKEISSQHISSCCLCGQTLPALEGNGTQKTRVCLSCLKKPPPWNALAFYAQYTELLKHIIAQYKYHKNFTFIPLLSAYLAQAYVHLQAQSIAQNASPLPYHMILPIPRHSIRLGAEGFNHVLELCRPLQTQFGITIHHQALQRATYTPAQVQLNATQRLTNPAESFKVYNEEVVSKNILLVDDIMTTGATLRHACYALHKAGAANIGIILIAKVTKTDF